MSNMYDVTIIGAGPAGLCLARSLSQIGLTVALVEKQTQDKLKAPPIDGRDIALTHFSKKMLSDFGVWNHIPADCISPIREARVFDGTSSRYMGLRSPATDQMAFIVPNHHIRHAAYEAVRSDTNITLLDNSTVEKLRLKDNCAEVVLSDGRHIISKLICAADSRFSETRRKAAISASMHDFGKTMIVCQMEHDREHNGVAHECFNHGHTLAVLPLNGNRSSVIITLPPTEAARMMNISTLELNLWVSEQFQHRLGNMRLDCECFSYPLVGVYANHFVSKRFALVGDAAVGMHPVTAHGFNFGLKSIHFLVDSIKMALASGGDIASEAVLSRYETAHRRATLPLYLATSGIVSLYTNDSTPAKIARKVLLHAANSALPIKSLLMAGLTKKEISRNPFGIPSPIQAAKRLLKIAA